MTLKMSNNLQEKTECQAEAKYFESKREIYEESLEVYISNIRFCEQPSA